MLLIADVPVDPESELVGQAVQDVHAVGQVRVLALRRAGAEQASWAPPGTYRLAARDRLVVLATRDGLSGLLARGGAAGAQPAPDVLL